MPLHNKLLTAFLLFLLPVLSKSQCINVATMIYTTFHLYVAQQYRGAPGVLFVQTFKISVEKIISQIKERNKYDPTQTLASVCFTNTQITDLKNQYKPSPTPGLNTAASLEYSGMTSFNLDPADWWGGPQNQTQYTTSTPSSSPTMRSWISHKWRRISTSFSFLSSLSAPSFKHTRKPIPRSTPLNAISLRQISSPSPSPTPITNWVNLTIITNDFLKDMFIIGGVEAAMNELSLLANSTMNSTVFYLPYDSANGQSLPTLGDVEQQAINAIWTNISIELNRQVESVVASSVAKLPNTATMFFDPNKNQTKSRYQSFLQRGQPIKAPTLIYQVAGMSIRMLLLGVPVDRAMSILHHATAYAFTAVRATNLEENDLWLSTAFMDFYTMAFNRYTVGKNISSVPEIKGEELSPSVKSHLVKLTTLISWGQLNYPLFYNGKAIRYESIIHVLLFKFLSNAFLKKVSRLPRGSNGMQQMWSSRQTVECESQYYYYAQALVLTDVLEYCCANVCADLPLILTVGLGSTRDCCQWCNQYNCVLDAANPLTPLVEIMIEQYGWYQGHPVPVMIF